MISLLLLNGFCFFVIKSNILDTISKSNDASLIDTKTNGLSMNYFVSYPITDRRFNFPEYNENDSKCNQVLNDIKPSSYSNSNTNEVDSSSSEKTFHQYPIEYNMPLHFKRETSVPNFQNKNITEKKNILIQEIPKLESLKDHFDFWHQIIYLGELLIHYNDTNQEDPINNKTSFMEQILKIFFMQFQINETAKEVLQPKVFALFSILNNSDAFQIKENLNQYDQLFACLFNLYNNTIDVSTITTETNILIIGTMAIYIDLFSYQELDDINENNENNPLNNIAKANTKNLISYLPKYAMKKFNPSQTTTNNLTNLTNFMFYIYDRQRDENITIAFQDMTITFNPLKLMTDPKVDLAYLAVYYYPYYPKISRTTSDYNHTFLGIKGYDNQFEEKSVNYIPFEVRPQINMTVFNTTIEKFCFFFNEEDFNPFSNLGIKQDNNKEGDLKILTCSVSMLRDFTYGDRQVMRLVWIGVLAGISLVILIILFILFLRFKKNGTDSDKENAFISSRLSNAI